MQDSVPYLCGYEAKLVVTPDNSTPGSEGRIYLLFPEELEFLVGRQYRPVGVFSRDDAILLVPTPTGSTVTPKRQLWWKNGVRDHGIRRNHSCLIWLHRTGLLCVELVAPTDEEPPLLPPYQDVLFEQ